MDVSGPGACGLGYSPPPEQVSLTILQPTAILMREKSGARKDSLSFRDAKSYQIVEGSSNIQKLIIAQDALGYRKANR